MPRDGDEVLGAGAGGVQGAGAVAEEQRYGEIDGSVSELLSLLMMV